MELVNLKVHISVFSPPFVVVMCPHSVVDMQVSAVVVVFNGSERNYTLHNIACWSVVQYHGSVSIIGPANVHCF